MDIRPPKRPTESFTIVRAKALIVFSRIVAGTALASQLGIFSFVPEKYQKPVSAGVMGIGILAILAGNEKQGSAIVQARLSKRDIFTEPNKPGASKENALFQVFLTAGELALAQTAVTRQNQPIADRPAKVPTVSMHETVGNLLRAQAATVINGLPPSIGDGNPIPSLLELSREVESL
jgi:hypothetical protein